MGRLTARGLTPSTRRGGRSSLVSNWWKACYGVLGAGCWVLGAASWSTVMTL
ncbi:hypothetical protein [Streptomyces sp. NPDC055085]